MTLKEFHNEACAVAADYGRMDATKIHAEVKYQLRADNGEDEFTWKIYDHHGGLFISTLEPIKVPNPEAALANYRLRLEVWKQAGGEQQDMDSEK